MDWILLREAYPCEYRSAKAQYERISVAHRERATAKVIQFADFDEPFGLARWYGLCRWYDDFEIFL